MQSEEHVSKLNEEKDHLISDIQQQAAKCSTLETEHVSTKVTHVAIIMVALVTAAG